MEATIQYISEELRGIYPKTEVRAFLRLILEHVCGLNYTQQLLMRDFEPEDQQRKTIYEMVSRLKRYEPIQYVLGETDFSGLRMMVTPAVLIPRPETGELVTWITETEIPVGAHILDIGTGSGCIALALKRQFPQGHVSGVDLSEEALEIARENAQMNGLDAQFSRADILSWEAFRWDKYEVIVSNPPYVRESEKAAMLPNVVRFEPAGALFVSDTDPLLFYRQIALFAKHQLLPGGWLFFEINEKLGAETCGLLREKGFREVEVKRDLSGKERMVRCRK